MASPIPGARPDYVRALHDFHSSNSSGTATLSFTAGQVIRVFNKDPTGWWDGELEGVRGWFPSNYVELLEGGIGEGTDEDEQDGPYDDSAESLAVQAGPVRRGSQPRDASAEGVLLSAIDQAVKVLQEAVYAGRANHFQPGTACVISAVRSVLSATDTLTRRSPSLKTSPSLGEARKRILNALATLVHQARVASAPTLQSGSADAALESQRMTDQAEAVVDHVSVFLDECAKAGVRVQAKSPEIGRDWQEGGAGGVAGLNLGLRQARSGQDLRVNARRPTLTVTTEGQTDPSLSVFSPDSPRHNHDDDEDDDQLDPFARSQTITSASDLTALLSGLQDTLLSSVAALIGHVHAHTRSAHGASYAQLVDLTRSTIERVREMLLVIEAVMAGQPSILPSSAERGLLSGCRGRLYEATTALATAARVATGPARAGEGEDEEKQNLLGTSHAVLRIGTDAINAVKACVSQLGGKPFSLFVNDISAPSTIDHNEAEEPAEVSFAREGPRRGRRGANTISMLGRKATSLSCLKDRFDSDGQLGGVGEEEEEEEEEDAEANRTATGINGLQVSAHGRKNSCASSIATTSDTVTSIQSHTPSPASLGQNDSQTRQGSTERAPSRAESGGSSVMARQDSSRTSESAASSRSALSRSSTNDTSPRSSVSTAPDSRKWSAEQHPPAMPAFSPMFSTRPGSVGQQSRLSTQSTPGASAQADDKWYLKRDYEDKEITFNSNGHVTGGTLRCLVERATLHDTTIDPAFLGAFLLTFRLFASPLSLLQALVDRFEMTPPNRADKPALSEAELKVWHDSKLTPVRLRIYNLIKTWVEAHWNPDADGEAIDNLLAFGRGSLAAAMPSAAQRLVDTVQKRVISAAAAAAAASSSETSHGQAAAPARPRMLNRMVSSDRLKAGKTVPVTADPYSHPLPGGPTPPPSVLGKSLLAALRTTSLGSVIEIDPLELARQLTIKESRVYLAIKPEELLGHSRKGNTAPNVSQMSALSTKLTGWVSETILHETDAKKRAGLVKYFIKLSQQCLALNNYNALMAVVCALTSSTISRLKKTWDGLAPKYRTLLEQLRRATEHSRNYAEYRFKLRNAVPPALPFVGLFLTDLTFSFEGNPAERPSPADPALRLINFDRYLKMAKIIQEQQRFQVPYNLLEVSEIQNYLDRALAGLKHERDGDSLWRQSLLVEPRDGQGGAQPASAGGHGHNIINWGGRI